MIIRAYMRASTNQQDAERARESLRTFADGKGWRIATYYVENASGASLERAELARLIDDSEAGDILLVEKIDRLSRLPYEQWQTLKGRLKSKGIRIVVLDQPMTHDNHESFISKALTEFMIDLAAGMAKDDYDTRRERQRQGIERARAKGKHLGRKADMELYARIRKLRAEGESLRVIAFLCNCALGTVQRALKD